MNNIFKWLRSRLPDVHVNGMYILVAAVLGPMTVWFVTNDTDAPPPGVTQLEDTEPELLFEFQDLSGANINPKTKREELKIIDTYVSFSATNVGAESYYLKKITFLLDKASKTSRVKLPMHQQITKQFQGHDFMSLYIVNPDDGKKYEATITHREFICPPFSKRRFVILPFVDMPADVAMLVTGRFQLHADQGVVTLPPVTFRIEQKGLP